MRVRNRTLEHGYWVLTAASIAGAMAMLAIYTPTQDEAGSIQKLFYLHLPAAIAMLVMAMLVFVSSLAFLWQHTPVWDDLAKAAGELTVLFGTVVLLTGMVWARGAWGHWWEWSAPLTFSLVLWVLYVGYLVLRPMLHHSTARQTIAAIYGVAAFLDVPLIYVALKLMPDRHSSSASLDASMGLTLAAWFVPVALLALGLLRARVRLSRRERALAEHEHDLNHHPFTNGVTP